MAVVVRLTRSVLVKSVIDAAFLLPHERYRQQPWALIPTCSSINRSIRTLFAINALMFLKIQRRHARKAIPIVNHVWYSGACDRLCVPVCRSTMSKRRMLNLPIKNITMSLQVRCPVMLAPSSSHSRLRIDNTCINGHHNDDSSQALVAANDNRLCRCSWQGKLADYLEKHQNKFIKCPRGC